MKILNDIEELSTNDICPNDNKNVIPGLPRQKLHGITLKRSNNKCSQTHKVGRTKKNKMKCCVKSEPDEKNNCDLNSDPCESNTSLTDCCSPKKKKKSTTCEQKQSDCTLTNKQSTNSCSADCCTPKKKKNSTICEQPDCNLDNKKSTNSCSADCCTPKKKKNSTICEQPDCNLANKTSDSSSLSCGKRNNSLSNSCDELKKSSSNASDNCCDREQQQKPSSKCSDSSVSEKQNKNPSDCTVCSDKEQEKNMPGYEEYEIACVNMKSYDIFRENYANFKMANSENICNNDKEAKKVWEKMMAIRKLPYFWIVINHEYVSADPIENFHNYYEHQKRNVSKAEVECMWNKLDLCKKMPFIFEAFLASCADMCQLDEKSTKKFFGEASTKYAKWKCTKYGKMKNGCKSRMPKVPKCKPIIQKCKTSKNKNRTSC